DAPEVADGGFDQRVERIPLADVAGDRQRLDAQRAGFLGDALAVVELAAGDDDVRPAGGEAEDDLAAEPAAAAGHQRGPSAEVERVHRPPSRMSRAVRASRTTRSWLW